MAEEQAELSGNENEAKQLQAAPEGQDDLEAQPPVGEQQEPEEFEVVLGSVEEPSTEQEKTQKKPRGVNRLLAERRDNKNEIEELRRENAALRNVPVQTNTSANSIPSMPIAPTEESTGYDPVALQQAQAKYAQDMSAYFSNNATNAAQAVYDHQQTTTQKLQQAEQQRGVIEAHYERAEKLNLPDYDAAEGKLVEILDQASVLSIAQMVSNSEAVIYYLGKNPDQAYKLRETWESKGSPAVLLKLGELSKDLRIVPKKRNKQRPAPESKVTGAAPASATQLDREIEAERERINSGEVKDFTELQKLKKLRKQASA